MKILLTTCGGIIKGLEWVEYGLAKALVDLGHDVTVISSTTPMKKYRNTRKKEVIDGINVRRFNPIMPSSLFYMLNEKFDVIHINHLGYLAPISSYAALAAKIKNIPTIFTVHGIYHDPFLVEDVEDPLSGKIHKRINKKFPYSKPTDALNWFVHLPLNSHKIAALTMWEKKELINLGVEKERILVIPDGINNKKFSHKKSPYFHKMGLKGPILLFVGQPAERKGWKYFLQSMPSIINKFPDATAVFIGYRGGEQIESYSKNLGIDASVKILGFLDEAEKNEAFASADIFVFPTLYEGFGVVFLEAMASGLGIVTTNVAGNKEIIEHGKNGLLVKPKDNKGLAKAVISLLQNKNLRNRMRLNNIAKAKTYDWHDIAKKYVSAYQNVVDSNTNK